MVALAETAAAATLLETELELPLKRLRRLLSLLRENERDCECELSDEAADDNRRVCLRPSIVGTAAAAAAAAAAEYEECGSSTRGAVTTLTPLLPFSGAAVPLPPAAKPVMKLVMVDPILRGDVKRAGALLADHPPSDTIR